ncbi:hypothetical protein GCM10011390_23000 [Aureimonas endophytica]|uniref:BD-FAE-like domain-containing protein n=1 Tax=Aureimonas endophytica TaxID=2027858 RepID=A0A916ZMX0_9HYPH|nr:alpha/beta hydrolase [Aureimonas endophytica]GGE03499.1 hypothetical protein GCM10011390_23000 [Aureimonas endophytica]
MISRRHVLTLFAAMLVPGTRSRAAPSELLALWPGVAPGGGGPSGEPLQASGGALRNIAVPAIEIVRPARPNGSAILVAAGGGYRRIEIGKEARRAALWLAARGITACILRYRLPAEGWVNGPLAPLQDAQRALRLLRGGRVPDIDPERIGALGFSAGGHLLGMAASCAAESSYEPVDAADRHSARPSALALLYPIVTLLPPYDDTSTRRILVGRHPTRSQSARWSVETHVHADCPPLLLVEALDDPIAAPANGALLARACRDAGVAIEWHRLASGGHGFGMGRPGEPSAAWPGWYEAWLRRQSFLP